MSFVTGQRNWLQMFLMEYNIVTPKRWKNRGTFHFFWVAIIHGGNSIDRLRASCCIYLSGQRQSFKPSQRQRYREGHELGGKPGDISWKPVDDNGAFWGLLRGLRYRGIPTF